ncbi:MAG: DUF4127 family protein [Negativicutes bacterium]|nr:DUF4127 family protein [Negativicutes bacterium]
MKKSLLVIVVFFALILVSPVQAQTIMYIPADNRPVSLDYVVDTAKAAGVEIITPQRALIAGRTDPGNPDYLWNWALSRCKEADAIVVSADSLLYGSLVASRTHQFPQDALQGRLAKFTQLKQLNPSARIYVFSTIMRTPQFSAGGVEPDYYEMYGPSIFRMTALQDKQETDTLSANEQSSLQTLTATIPPAALADWFGRRDKNYKMNVGLIAYAKDSTFDYLIQGRDDCSPYSQSHKESRYLAVETQRLSASRYSSFPGADQLGMLLVARAVNDFFHQVPVVSVMYAPGAGGKTVPTYEDKEVAETVNQQIISAGGVLLPSPQRPDLILAINTPENGITLEANNVANRDKTRPATTAFVNQLAETLASGKQVAVASIAFSNGADNALMCDMARRGLLPKLAAFSGWNTASNTLGYAVGQGMLAAKMQPDSRKQLLAVRLLDDWAYQANVRGEIAESVLYPLGGSYFNLDEIAPRLTTETERRLRLFADKNFRGFDAGHFQVSFPWNRMFEVKIATE